MQPRPRSAIVARIEVYYSHTHNGITSLLAGFGKSRFEELPSGQAKRGMARE